MPEEETGHSAWGGGTKKEMFRSSNRECLGVEKGQRGARYFPCYLPYCKIQTEIELV